MTDERENATDVQRTDGAFSPSDTTASGVAQQGTEVERRAGSDLAYTGENRRSREDRRKGSDPNYAGPERRTGDRRSKP